MPDVNYSWSDGSTEMPRTVNSEGLYTLIATVDGCSFTDSVAVLESDCDHLVELPNVFTPNGDGSNAVFMPIRCWAWTASHSRFTTVGAKWFPNHKYGPELGWANRCRKAGA